MKELVLSEKEEEMLYEGICPYCQTDTVGNANQDNLLFKYKKLCIHTSCDKCKEHFSMYFKLSYSTFYSYAKNDLNALYQEDIPDKPEEKGEKECQKESESKIINLNKVLTKKRKTENKPPENHSN